MNRKPRFTFKKALAAAAFVLLIAALSLVYAAFREEGVSGRKDMTIEVVSASGKSQMYEVRTDALYLRGAMEDAAGLSFAGTEGPYGLMITTVNGETADFDKDGAYWGFSVNGSYCQYGIDEQPVHDGDAFVIAYTR